MDFAIHEIVLSPAKLCNSAFSIQILKRMKRKIDPCGTPDNKTFLLFIFTFCFQPFKYEQTNIFEVNQFQNHKYTPLLLTDRGEYNQSHLKSP